MADTPTGAGWMKDWEALSRQYWSAWQDATRQLGGAAQMPATPWHEGFEQWSRMFSGAGAQSETVERLMASAKGYAALMQAMIANAAGKGGETPAAWADALRQGFNMPGLDPSLMNNPVARSMREVVGQGAKSFEQMMANLAPLAMPAASEAKSWLNVPAFGYLREHQERVQKTAAAFVDYQEQLARYNALILEASRRGFEKFESKLAEREEPGRQIDSMRALYDLWVDAAEEAYAEIALSEEFRKVYGDLVNAQMRARSHVQQEVERLSAELGMPTRAEINTLGQRIHEVRREVKKRGGGSADGLAAEVAALRKQVAALERQLAEKPADKPAKPAGDKPAKKNAAARATSPRGVKSSKPKR